MRHVEDEWTAGVFEPPAKRPTYDMDLDRWIRSMRERVGHDRIFYNSAAWRHLREKVLDECHCESLYERSLSPARYVRATTVHHVMHLDRFPGWGLSEWAVDVDGQLVRNLVPLSHDAHDIAHGRFIGCGRRKSNPVTEEWW